MKSTNIAADYYQSYEINTYIDFGDGQDSKAYLFSKRIMDIVLSIIGIILLSPLIIVVAVLIKLDSKGPVFFIQNRCGTAGRIFKMFKFRSMCCDAEKELSNLEHLNEAKGLLFKIKKDPRVTKVGKIIRRTSIDELPQLFNVLKGDMSIVGPRPPVPSEFEKYDSWQKLRLSVKPGITGLWQVSGRSKLGFNEMVELDLKYIRDRNIKRDLKIIFKTIPTVLRMEGAY